MGRRARVRRPLVQVDAEIPVELLDVDAPEWSCWEAVAEWCAERGYQRPRGRLRPWYSAGMFHRQAVERWARENGRVFADGRVDWVGLEALGVPVVEVEPECWQFPPEVRIDKEGAR